MQIKFTFNEGDGVQDDGTYDFLALNAAKRDALLALSQSLREDARLSGEINGAVAGFDSSGKPLFSITMHIVIEDLVSDDTQ
jgi:hypothetical protein